MGKDDALEILLKIHEQDKKENPERYAPRPETLVPGYNALDDPKSPFYTGAHDAPMLPPRKLNLIQLASLGVDLDLYVAGKSQL